MLRSRFVALLAWTAVMVAHSACYISFRDLPGETPVRGDAARDAGEGALAGDTTETHGDDAPAVHDDAVDHPDAGAEAEPPDGDAEGPDAGEMGADDADDASTDGEDGATCPRTWDYMRDAGGRCWLERAGVAVEEVPCECCYYRLCQYGCGPEVPPEECSPALREEYVWCHCSTPGPPSWETDPFECEAPVAHSVVIMLVVRAPCETNRAEYEAVAASLCAIVFNCGHVPGLPDGEDGVFVHLQLGTCPWHAIAVFEELDSVLYGLFTRTWGTEYPLPPCE